MNELRVMAGKNKGVSLRVPESARPMTSRVKGVIFDILMNHIKGAKVLDLFAGSGNIGIEALSRGANYSVFVDHNTESVKLINSNLKKIKAEENSNVHQIDYKIFLKKTDEKFDLIFIDPPFDFIEKVNLRLLPRILEKDGIIILKINTNNVIKIPKELEINYEKELGKNKILFMTFQNQRTTKS